MGAVTGHGRHGDWAWGQDDPARRWLSMMMRMMACDAGGLCWGIVMVDHGGGLGMG
ncbi:MAG: hypothetical protein ACPID2_05620 [Candidatus Puniceispirillum sp.]